MQDISSIFDIPAFSTPAIFGYTNSPYSSPPRTQWHHACQNSFSVQCLAHPFIIYHHLYHFYHTPSSWYVCLASQRLPSPELHIISERSVISTRKLTFMANLAASVEALLDHELLSDAVSLPLWPAQLQMCRLSSCAAASVPCPPPTGTS